MATKCEFPSAITRMNKNGGIAADLSARPARFGTSAGSFGGRDGRYIVGEFSQSFIERACDGSQNVSWGCFRRYSRGGAAGSDCRRRRRGNGRGQGRGRGGN